MSEPKRTIAEQLDAAETGEQFGQVLMGFFAALEGESRYRWLFEEEADEDDDDD